MIFGNYFPKNVPHVISTARNVLVTMSKLFFLKIFLGNYYTDDPKVILAGYCFVEVATTRIFWRRDIREISRGSRFINREIREVSRGSRPISQHIGGNKIDFLGNYRPKKNFFLSKKNFGNYFRYRQREMCW